MTNKELYEAALDAINELFNDCSVSKKMAKENLEGLLDEIEVMIESLGLD